MRAQHILFSKLLYTMLYVLCALAKLLKGEENVKLVAKVINANFKYNRNEWLNCMVRLSILHISNVLHFHSFLILYLNSCDVLFWYNKATH